MTWIVFASYLPGMVVVWALTRSETAMVVAFGVWGAAFVITALRLGWATCPQCGEWFHTRRVPHSILWRYSNPFTHGAASPS